MKLNRKSLVFIFLLTLVFLEASIFLMSKNSSSQVSDNTLQNLDKCQDGTYSKKYQCWDTLIDNSLKKGDLDGAFEIVDSLFKKDQDFAYNCHGYAHKLGEAAYKLFSNGQKFSLTQKTAYCGYGFYHGFMETLLLTTGDMDRARQFCDYADRQLAGETVDAGGACYHGIGHGSVDGSDPRAWGNAQAMIEPGLALCEQVSDNESRLFRCVSGAFNALEILTSQGKYSLLLNHDDPFWICRDQPEKYKRSCYTQMVVAAMNVSKNDFSKTAKFIDTIKEDKYAVESMGAMVMERVRLGKIDFGQTVDFCHNLGKRFSLGCISSYGEGLMKYGPPQTEYVEALKFCAFEGLSEEEHKSCFERILSLLRNWYTVGKSVEICKMVESQYRLRNCVYR